VTASANLQRIALDTRNVPRSALIEMAKVSKRIASEEARRAGSPWRSNKGRPIRLRAVDHITTRGTKTFLRIQGVPVGPWVWATSGTEPHLVGVGRTRPGGRTTARRAKKAKYLKGAGYSHPVRAPVAHPGTSGRRAWSKVRIRVRATTKAVFGEQVHKAVTGGR